MSLLINILADERIQQALDTFSRKRQIFENIAKCLEGGGFIRPFYQVIATKSQS